MGFKKRSQIDTYFEYHDARSHKFWEITLEGNSHSVRFGKVNTQGQSKTKTFVSEIAAQADADKLTRSKQKKGYRKTVSTPSTPSMAKTIDDLMQAMIAWHENFFKDDEESLKEMRPRIRPPATVAELKALEARWGRTVPPSYRAFLEVANGIENMHGTHLLLGTKDHLSKWSEDQVAEISQFWNEEDDDEYNGDTVIPLAVPEGDTGISNFHAFERSDKEEMQIIDWDNGSAFKRYDTFRSYLESALKLARK